MLNWFFKKRPAQPGAATAPAATPAAPKPRAGSAPPAPPAPRKPPPPVEDWAARLQAAQGDDAALLALARSAAPLDVKTACVTALSGEAALREAELALRERDRKVHRLAKQRLAAAVAQREARAQAVVLLQRAAVLAADEQLPINHLVDLDRAWQALPQQHLEPAQRDEFTALRARLDEGLRQREEARLAQARDKAQAEAQARAEAEAEAQRQAEEAAARAAAAQAAAAAEAAAAAAAAPEAAPAAPPAPRPPRLTPEQRERASEALQQGEAALAEGRLSDLQRQLQAIDKTLGSQDLGALPEALRGRLVALRAEASRLKAWQQWGGSRAREDLVHEAEVLATRTLAALPQEAAAAQVEGREEPAAQVAEHAPVPQAGTGSAPAAVPGVDPAPEPAAVAVEAPAAAEAAPAADAASVAVSSVASVASSAADATASAPSAPESDATPATHAADAPAAPDATTAGTARPPRPSARPGPPAPRIKLDLNAHAEQIRQLRARWKELDRLGAMAPQALWQRFDGALQTAYQPIAVQQAALRAARQDNLAQRQALLDSFEALPEPLPADDGTPPDWRGLISVLDQFQQAWRKLGPVEHTVPAPARAPLAQRLQAALQRLEAPLQQARAQAAQQREALIAQAHALAPGAAGPAWEAARRVRELQQQWQEHARALPLQRQVETALWSRFKAATDAVFAQRDAEAAARDAERNAALAEREALLARLESVSGTDDEAAIATTLAEVDRGWRQAGEPPRAAQAALERRLQAAHDRAQALLRERRQQRWQAQCDALVAMVEGTGTVAPPGAAALPAGTDHADAPAAPTPGAPTLPAAWALALARRSSGATLPADEADALLLQLESALDVPVSPALQEARRLHKLQALKHALEGRGGAAAAPRKDADALTTLLAAAGLQPAQHERLRAIAAALRRAAPDTLLQRQR